MNDDESSQRSAELNSYHRDIQLKLGRSTLWFRNRARVAADASTSRRCVPRPNGGAATLKPARSSERLTTSTASFGRSLFDPSGERLTGITAIDPQDAQPGELFSPRPGPKAIGRRQNSVVLAGVTTTPSTSPKVSTSRWRLRPLIRLPASYPTSPPGRRT